jgi:nitrite reductase/ring-hydroxylating ferredoxin subunit
MTRLRGDPSAADAVPVSDLAELQARRRLAVRVDGAEVLLLWAANRVVAVANACPHAGWPLDTARLCGLTLQCVAHLWRFDLQTGRIARRWWNPPTSADSRARLPVYRTFVKDGQVFVHAPRATTTRASN